MSAESYACDERSHERQQTFYIKRRTAMKRWMRFATAIALALAITGIPDTLELKDGRVPKGLPFAWDPSGAAI